jgi:hypothetical protein
MYVIMVERGSEKTELHQLVFVYYIAAMLTFHQFDVPAAGTNLFYITESDKVFCL